VRYDAIDVSQSDRQTTGQLSEHPLAELIREVIDADLSGALRLSKGPAKVVIYFEKGELLFATSNLKAHRLRNVLQRKLTTAIDQLSADSDEELAATLVERGLVTADEMREARSAQASDVLRVALLWTEGQWSYERRVRVDAGLRVAIDVNRLLLECARHLPLEFLKARVGVGAASYSVMKVDGVPLSPTEAMTLARVTQAGDEVNFADLTTRGLRAPEALRGIYALGAAGLLRASDYKPVLSDGPPAREKAKPAKAPAPAPPSGVSDVDGLFQHMASATTHYQVLNVPIAANETEIKNAYHDLARRFHPDRFHQSELRAQVESAFARIGRAYETLIDEARRKEYDRSLTAKPTARASAPAPTPAPAAKKAQPVAAPASQKQSAAERAEASFQLGTAALDRNQPDDAVRYLAESATLEPRVARYRAYYGAALARKPSLRRSAETELQAALKIEPDNALFRVMLAELYQQLGLRKRAETEAARALSVDPTNKSARTLLSNLSSK
jgi:curved DNA-binding protein CbpA